MAERLGGLKIHDEARPCWLLEGQISGLLALQYPQDGIRLARRFRSHPGHRTSGHRPGEGIVS